MAEISESSAHLPCEYAELFCKYAELRPRNILCEGQMLPIQTLA